MQNIEFSFVFSVNSVVSSIPTAPAIGLLISSMVIFLESSLGFQI